jgi:hypothetical protein
MIRLRVVSDAGKFVRGKRFIDLKGAANAERKVNHGR